MGMLDTSTGLLKALPEKPSLSESDSLGAQWRQRSGVDGYGFGFNGSGMMIGGAGGGFGIGAARVEGSINSYGGDRDADGAMGNTTSGLASPSSSSGGSGQLGREDGY